MNIRKLLLIAAISLNFNVAESQQIFFDSFNGDTTSGGINSDVNSDYDTRQSGQLRSEYRPGGEHNGQTYIQTSTGTVLTGETVLLLRTQGGDGTVASNAFITTDLNFGNALAGKKYVIKFSGFITMSVNASDNHWGSFILSDSSSATHPTAVEADYGLLFRERDTKNLTIYKDGTKVGTSDASDGGTSLFKADTLFNLEISVDEANGTIDTVLNKGLANEIALNTENIDFNNITHRYFSFRANQGNAAGLVDFNFEDFSITVIPESKNTALFLGLFFLISLYFIKNNKSGF